MAQITRQIATSCFQFYSRKAPRTPRFGTRLIEETWSWSPAVGISADCRFAPRRGHRTRVQADLRRRRLDHHLLEILALDQNCEKRFRAGVRCPKTRDSHNQIGFAELDLVV
ncbi:hypothetical protein Mp_1g09550 [Marchantia polymorpha subsp. ruderalis]|uniref:Uncharacterized protein n=2 Tax=Marchantia polymorpha TaxID=3197 RepID=A0AAF6ANB1_MARPO|nr:hypothetical protein MARPO_0096s0045 [Marchantia polymorpha]BBM97931.1 hypothetical protein Mp_1g09550 [Marchantia polymorpha subsp. ruderalis]|eukprot:PTQ32698.1 hypothetical protein MARPO_0096s0045 [Marchantia polymorpha]